MSDREQADIDLGILSIGREWDEHNCRCDPSVGMFPCHYCAEHSAILAGERLLAQLAEARAALERIREEVNSTGMVGAICLDALTKLGMKRGLPILGTISDDGAVLWSNGD